MNTLYKTRSAFNTLVLQPVHFTKENKIIVQCLRRREIGVRNLDLTPIDFRVLLSRVSNIFEEDMQSKDNREWKLWIKRINVWGEDNGGDCGTNARSHSPILGGGVFSEFSTDQKRRLCDCLHAWLTQISFLTVQPHCHLGQHRAVGGVLWNLLISVAFRSHGPRYVWRGNVC